MKEIAFCSVPMVGHLTPLLPYAAELLSRGHAITFFHDADPRYRQKLERCGLGACKSVTYDCNGDSKKPWTWRDPIFNCIKSYYEAEGAIPAAMVYEFFAVDAADAADAMGVPAVGVFPNPRSLNPWPATLEAQQSAKWAIWCAMMWGAEAVMARFLCIARSWYRWKRGLARLSEQDLYPSPFMPRPMIGCTSPLFEFPDLPMAPNYHMVGPALPDSADHIDEDLLAWLESQKGRPVVYVAFGTLFKYTLESVRKLEASFLELDDSVAILWSLPEQAQSFLGRSPRKNWRVEPFLPQVSLFRSGKIEAFVTHCGSNSVYEALLSGVPMVCCPAFADQPANATRLVRAGVGIIARNGQVGRALEELLGDLDAVTQTSKELAKKLQSHCGAQRAATLIEEVANGNGEVITRRGRLPLVPLVLLGTVLSVLYSSI